MAKKKDKKVTCVKRQQIKTNQVYMHKQTGDLVAVTNAYFALNLFSGAFKHQLCSENEQGCLVVIFLTTEELLNAFTYLDTIELD